MPLKITNEFLQELETLDLYIKNVIKGRFCGSRLTRAHGSSLEWMDDREYEQGDDPRKIDWNMLARADKYYIKQYHDERQLNMRIYIDGSASMGWCKEKKELALRLALTFGYLSVSNMDRVGYRLLARSSCETFMNDMTRKENFYLASLQLDQLQFAGETDLNASIRSDIELGYDNGISFIISDFLTDSDWKSAVDYLLSTRREVVLVRILSPEEIHPQCSGRMQFLDSEESMGAEDKSMKVEVNRSALRAYEKAYQAFEKDINDFCARRDVLLLSLHSDERLEDIILTKAIAAGVIR